MAQINRHIFIDYRLYTHPQYITRIQESCMIGVIII
jgi:hypothetical protein